MGGPGETQIARTDRRQLAEKIGKLKREPEEVRRTRGLHRDARKRVPYPVLALVGYTNAGKSTLFNRLTHAQGRCARPAVRDAGSHVRRAVKLPGGRVAILSDTVGFISDLPHELVEAFRATLEEVQEADVVLHVRDIASAESEVAQAADVAAVMEEIKQPARNPAAPSWKSGTRLTCCPPRSARRLLSRSRKEDRAPRWRPSRRSAGERRVRAGC